MVGERRSRLLRAAAIGVLCALSLTACRTDRKLTKPAPVPVTEQRLQATLLTTADLPAGFTTKEGSGSPISTEIVPEHQCDDALKTLKPKMAVSTDLTGNGQAITDVAAWFPGQGAAVEKVYRDIGASCSAIVVPAEGLTVRAGSLDFGVLSDNALGIRIEVEPKSGPITERDLIVLRQGDLVHVIRLVGPRPSDKALLDAAVRATIGRLGLLHADTSP